MQQVFFHNRREHQKTLAFLKFFYFLFFLPVCQDFRCDLNLVGHMSDTKFVKWTVETQSYFFRKIVSLTIRYQKIKQTEKYFHWKKCTVT